MLTVKHVAESREEIHLAPHGVVYFGSGAVLGKEAPGFIQGGPRLLIKNGSDDEVEGRLLYRGTAYVMNGAGATVGVYRLGYPPEQQRTAIYVGDVSGVERIDA